MLTFQYTDTELKKIMSTLTIIIDSREQRNEHILAYFDEKKVAYEVSKLDTGDYSCKIPKNEAYGITRDLYLSSAVERKNSIDELAQSTKEDRFEAELIRSQKLTHFALLVEDTYENLVTGNYRSQYDPKALLGRLKSFESKYGFSTAFIGKALTGHYILHELWYRARNELKKLG